MAFGFSFGKNKTRVEQDTTVNKTETTNQQQNTNQSQTQTGTSNTNTSQTGSTTGTQATKNSGTTTNQTTGTQAQTGLTQSFSDMILGALEAKTAEALGVTTGGPTAESLSGFNRDQFVQGGMQAAQATSQAGLEQSINGLMDNVGGTTEGNSMAALLANRLRNDAGASMAGTRSQLEGQAAQIQQGNVAARTQELGTNNAFVAQLLAGLKGGVTATSGTVQTAESQAGSQQQIGDSRTAENTQSSQQQQTESTQALVSIIQQLISGTTNTQGTESVDGTTTKKGGGVGLSI